MAYPTVSVGCRLSRGRGFSFRLERPCLSFKTFRALHDGGLGPLANRVGTTNKRSTITPENVWCGILKCEREQGRRIPLQYQSYYEAALNWLRKEITAARKHPLHQIAKVAYVLPQSTSPGLPYIQTHPGMKGRDVANFAVPEIIRYWQHVGDGNQLSHSQIALGLLGLTFQIQRK